MTHPPELPTIAYATSAGDDAALPRALRLALGWAAIVYGGGGVVARVYFIALSRKWFPSGVSFGPFTVVQDAIDWASAAAALAVGVAGALVLRRAPAGAAALRLAAAFLLLCMYAHQVHDTLRSGGEFAFRGYSLLYTLTLSSVLPALMIVLTLGPLGRALRRP